MKELFIKLLLLCALLKSSLSLPLIVPEELPSILSLVYSNIPPIKKGTDSRVGFGFRLGEHADFQVLFEIGPQTNTKPIGGEASSDRRRYAEVSTKSSKISNSSFKENVKEGSWMEKWSKNNGVQLETPQKKQEKDQQQKKTAIKNVTVAPETVMHLYQLFGSQHALSKTSTENVENTTSLPKQKDLKKISAELANVEFDDF
ncbi:uncharacterized protein LOC134831931 [Culicoides brevitarsis]|uniref:uncharacterized protein LOC134831931 n=1 Tax=Culicoides brevitarsis TaxID=469753 RepID=UPI00307CB19E